MNASLDTVGQSSTRDAVGNRATMETGTRIRNARESCGHTLAVLAAIAGIHINTLSCIERGRQKPTSETLNRISAALGRSVDELLGLLPVRAPEPQAVEAFLMDFRMRSSSIFEEWTDEMWNRYLALGVRFAVINDAAACHFAGRVNRECYYINQLRDLLDAGLADTVIAAISCEHARLPGGPNAPASRG